MKNVRKEKINQGPLQASGTWIYYLEAYFVKKEHLFACYLCLFQIDFLKNPRAVYWVVAPKFIKYATT